MLPIFNDSETNDRLAALLDAPMLDWRRNVSAVIPEHRARMICSLDSFIETACRLRAYVESTTGERDTDTRHDRAVRRSNGLATKVRRALGYSQPRADVRF